MSGTETTYGPGATGASAAQAPGTPQFEGHGSGTIEISFSTGTNAAEVEYELRVKEDPENDGSYALKGYVQADGSVAVGEVWQTAAAWGATVEISGLTDFVGYTGAARARSEMGAGTETAWSAESVNMNTLPDIDEGIETRTGEDFLPSSANVRVDDSATITPTGSAVTETTETDYYGDITIPYTALGHDSDLANLEVQFNEYKSEAWQGWSAATIYASPTGDGASNLATSEAGTAHTAVWNGYADAGESENCPVKFQLRLQDEAAKWSAYVETAEINYRNLPGEITFYYASATPGTAGPEWDDDTTPTFETANTAYRGGSVGFPVISVWNKDTGTTLVFERKSVEDQTGWQYKIGAGAWTDMTSAGIPSTATYIRYTVQAADALTENTNYIVTGRMGEVRNLS